MIFNVEMGKVHGDDRPLAFARCVCGTMLLTTSANNGNDGECLGCQYEREHPVQGPVQTRDSFASRAMMTMFVLVIVGWLGYVVSTAPARARLTDTQQAW